jgi:hypothetical protein
MVADVVGLSSDTEDESGMYNGMFAITSMMQQHRGHSCSMLLLLLASVNTSVLLQVLLSHQRDVQVLLQ